MAKSKAKASKAVEADKMRLQAYSRSDLRDDASRGASSPLGQHQMEAPPKKKGKSK
jgi:hypothetical protein